jgi:hypothetical protein
MSAEALGWNDQYPWLLCGCHSVVRSQPRGRSCAEQRNPTCVLGPPTQTKQEQIWSQTR